MIYRGIVKNGVVVFEGDVVPPDGSEVSVRPRNGRLRTPKHTKTKTAYERLKPFIGKVTDLPADFAENHDHYLYGVSKRKKR